MAELGLTEGMMKAFLKGCLAGLELGVSIAAFVAVWVGLPALFAHAMIQRRGLWPAITVATVAYVLFYIVTTRVERSSLTFKLGMAQERIKTLEARIEARVAQDEAHEAEMQKRWARLDAIIAAGGDEA